MKSRCIAPGSSPLMEMSQEFGALAPIRQAGAGVPGTVWSPSSLKSLLLCPRQYRYAAIDRIPAVPNASLVFGTVLHEMLFLIHEWQRESLVPSVNDVLTYFDTRWSRALERENPFFRRGGPDGAQHGQLGREILRSYLRGLEGTRPPLAVALPFAIRIGDDILRGVIDRVDETEEGLCVVDFKSGARKSSQAEIDRNLQLTVCACAAERHFGRPVAYVAQLHLRDGSYRTSRREPADFTRLAADVIPSARRMLSEEWFPPRTGYYCRWCDFRELCQAERNRQLLPVGRGGV